MVALAHHISQQGTLMLLTNLDLVEWGVQGWRAGAFPVNVV